MKKSLLISLTAAALIFSACGTQEPEKFDTNSSIKERNIGANTVFDSANGDIPYPNNILFAGSSDGKLRISYDKDAADASVKAALTSLDGFSTQAPISISLTQEMDSATLKDGVHLYEANATASAETLGIPTITAITKELTFGIDFIATMSGTKLVIVPLKPLASHTNYVVALTNKITDKQGNKLVHDAVTPLLNSKNSLVDSKGKSLSANLSDEKAQKLEGLRKINQATYKNVLAQGIKQDELVITWSFQTQTIGKVTEALMEKAKDVNSSLTISSFNGLNSNQMIALAKGATLEQIATIEGNASMFAGVLNNLPYYLGVPTQENPYTPLSEYFEFNQTNPYLPAKRADVTVPLLVAIPNGAHCKDTNTSGWPVVIFQHGVTVDRTVMLPLAETITRTCHAVVAMDLPLHGVIDVNSSLYQKENERHFNLLDLDQDGDADSDDTLVRYVNLKSLRTTRDNMRQSASDFVVLLNALKANEMFDGSNISFVGHSLGTISAIPFLTEANLTSVTLAMPGGGIAELFSGSKRYGPTVRAMLQQAAGIEPNSAEYASFLLATQTMIDDADPINYAQKAGERQKGKTLTFEVVGNDDNPSDIVIPNSVATAPLAGTDPFLRLYGADANKSIKLLAAEHSSILTPAPVNDDNSGISPTDLNASFYQIQNILGNFIATKQVGELNATLAKDSSK